MAAKLYLNGGRTLSASPAKKFSQMFAMNFEVISPLVRET